VALLDLDDCKQPHLFEPGCGIGGGVTQVAAMLPLAKVTGLSLVGKQLDIGRAMARARGLTNTEFVQGNYLGTAFPDAHFDGIFAIETLVYTPILERPALFRELFRILRPGRTLVSFDGFRLRDPVGADEREWVQDVLDGWTIHYRRRRRSSRKPPGLPASRCCASRTPRATFISRRGASPRSQLPRCTRWPKLPTFRCLGLW
jgi:ubiquinone/menaquinone biosynthesis C-methylase UbiE